MGFFSCRPGYACIGKLRPGPSSKRPRFVAFSFTPINAPKHNNVCGPAASGSSPGVTARVPRACPRPLFAVSGCGPSRRAARRGSAFRSALSPSLAVPPPPPVSPGPRPSASGKGPRCRAYARPGLWLPASALRSFGSLGPGRWPLRSYRGGPPLCRALRSPRRFPPRPGLPLLPPRGLRCLRFARHLRGGVFPAPRGVKRLRRVACGLTPVCSGSFSSPPSVPLPGETQGSV